MDGRTGNRIKSLRNENGMMQKELAKILKERYGFDTPTTTLSRWENGKQEPEVSKLKAIAEIFGVTIDYVAGISDDRTGMTRKRGLVASIYDDYDVFYDDPTFENETELWKKIHSTIDKNRLVWEINTLLIGETDENLTKIAAMIELLK